MNGIHVLNIVGKVHTYKLEELKEVTCVLKTKPPNEPKLSRLSCLKYECHRQMYCHHFSNKSAWGGEEIVIVKKETINWKDRNGTVDCEVYLKAAFF